MELFMQDFIALANTLADEARLVVQQYFRKSVDVISKEDASPVTIADREVEKRLRAIIEEHRPDDGIYGEEFGVKDSKNGYTWVIDPIDGTKSFVIGRATFGTLIALCKDDVPILGVIDQPVLKERWLGAEGKTLYSNDHLGGEFINRPIKTASCGDLKQARAACTAPDMFREERPEFVEDFISAVNFVAWGGDCYSFGLLSMGFADVIIEANLSPYDFAALVPVVEGAGGFMRDWDGNQLTLKSEGKVIALGDPQLWSAAARILKA